jgi:hypothetical protein
MSQRAVLYLDLDDTVIRWQDGTPSGAAGIGAFLEWALDSFEVRWLTRWTRDGQMQPRLLHDLAAMSGIPASRLATISGLDWNLRDCKLDGIAWLEHVVLRRPFLWVEDETVGDGVIEFLRRHGFGGSYYCCNVSCDAGALQRLHQQLRDTFGAQRDAA